MVLSPKYAIFILILQIHPIMLLKSSIFYCFAILCVVFSCTRPKTFDPVIPEHGPFTQYMNVVYGHDDTEQQSLDVALPLHRNIKTTPVLILVHGGAWSAGYKNDFYGYGLDTFFTAHGYAVVNINYRLDFQHPYPAGLNDLGLVVDFIRQRATVWQVNPNKIFFLGRSAGAHLALLYAYSIDKGRRVRAVIDGFGPVDLEDSTIAYGKLKNNVSYMLGSLAQNRERWREASPINYMASAVPTIILQGTADSLVPAKQSNRLYDSLVSRGISALYIPWQGNAHGWLTERWKEHQDESVAFMDRYR